VLGTGVAQGCEQRAFWPACISQKSFRMVGVPRGHPYDGPGPARCKPATTGARVHSDECPRVPTALHAPSRRTCGQQAGHGPQDLRCASHACKAHQGGAEVHVDSAHLVCSCCVLWGLVLSDAYQAWEPVHGCNRRCMRGNSPTTDNRTY